MTNAPLHVLRRVEPSAPLCAHKGEPQLHYVSAEHTAQRGVLATAALHRRLTLVQPAGPAGRVVIPGRTT